MPVITLSREMGSLGTAIARQVAETLSYRLVWREVINQAACRAGAPEVALAAIDDLGLLGVRPTFRQRRAYRRCVQQVIEELATQGNIVIVGRASQVVLKDYADTLHVKVIAPLDLRIQRTAAQQQIPIAAARAQVVMSDRTRREYLRRAYYVDWNTMALYDLVINTRSLTVAAATDLITRALGQRGSSDASSGKDARS
jgi:cytidylate kinase